MKAISLWQPWASLIGRGKSIETRSWKTDYRGAIAIHAAKRWTQNEANLCETEPFRTVLERNALLPLMIGGKRDFRGRLPFGAIIALATLTDCIPTVECRATPWTNATEAAFGNFAAGRYGWLLSDILILPEPIPCVGRQGLFNLDAETIKLIENQGADNG